MVGGITEQCDGCEGSWRLLKSDDLPWRRKGMHVRVAFDSKYLYEAETFHPSCSGFKFSEMEMSASSLFNLNFHG